MLDKNLDVWNIVFYDKLSLINKLHFYNINIYNFKKIGDYKFYFETERKNRIVIKKNFKECKLVSRKGFLNYLEAIVTRTTFICIIVASLFLYNASRRIWKIEISGDYEEIEESLKEEMIKNNLIVSKFYPNSNKLKEIEASMSLYLSKEIEFLELRRKGAVITLRYQKRRTAKPLPEKGANLYATKNGMIRYFKVQSGVKQVKEYEYVREGDLLVRDVVETSGGDLINIGTLGSVFANTFYIIDVELNHDKEDEASVFSKMFSVLPKT